MIPGSVSGRRKRRRREGEKTQDKYELYITQQSSWVSGWEKKERKEGGIERLRLKHRKQSVV